MFRIVVPSVLVTGFGTVGALDVAANFNLANVERRAVIWKPQEVENLRAVRLGIIVQESAAGTSGQAAVAIESTAGIAVVKRYRYMIWGSNSKGRQRVPGAGKKAKEEKR
jgi:hypothetical protein